MKDRIERKSSPGLYRVSGIRFYNLQLRINHNKYFSGGSFEVLHKWESMKFQHLMRWKWYFNYLVSKYQVAHPHSYVYLYEYSYEPTSQEEKDYQFKIRVARYKAAITKLKKEIKQHEDYIDNKNANEIFKIRKDAFPLYVKALAKLKLKEENLKIFIETKIYPAALPASKSEV